MSDDTTMVKTTETHTTKTETKAPANVPVQDSAENPSLLSNVLAIVGLVILIVIVIWGLVHLALLVSPSFSSLFNSKTPATIQVSAPSTTVSGEPMNVSWKYSPASSGNYALIYSCVSGVQFNTSGTASTSEAVPCGTSYLVGTANNLTLTPELSGNTTTSLPLTIVYVPQSTTTPSAQGSATVAISPAAQKPAPTTTPSPSKPVPAPTTHTSGPADLSVRIISVTADEYGNGVATFDIANIGSGTSGTYYFTATLPTQTGYTYASPAQSPLAPSAHVVSTLRFTQAVPGTFSVAVGASDANQSNNYAATTLILPNTGYYTYPPQQVYNQPQPYYTY